jgi:hypothetical protein
MVISVQSDVFIMKMLVFIMKLKITAVDLYFHCVHRSWHLASGDFFDFSVPIMKSHPKLTIYDFFSQYMPQYLTTGPLA